MLASSNLKDIKTYCNKNQITYLTTFDFLYHAVKKQTNKSKKKHAILLMKYYLKAVNYPQ